MVGDTIARHDESLPGEPLLRPVMLQGARLPESRVSLEEIRAYAEKERNRLPESLRQLDVEVPYQVSLSDRMRSDLETLKRVLVPTHTGAQVPIGQLTNMRLTTGTTMIRSEGAELVGYVYVDVTGRDLGGYVEEARRLVSTHITLPASYHLEWSGQYEYMQRAKERLKYVIPLTALIIFILIYLNTSSLIETVIVLLAVPFSLVGAFWLLYLLGYNLSVAVWVGIIALAGLDAETGVVMLLYLNLSYQQWRQEGRLKSLADLEEAVLHGAVKRVRPKIMTVSAAFLGLMPIMWSVGTGAADDLRIDVGAAGLRERIDLQIDRGDARAVHAGTFGSCGTDGRGRARDPRHGGAARRPHGDSRGAGRRRTGANGGRDRAGVVVERA